MRRWSRQPPPVSSRLSASMDMAIRSKTSAMARSTAATCAPCPLEVLGLRSFIAFITSPKEKGPIGPFPGPTGASAALQARREHRFAVGNRMCAQFGGGYQGLSDIHLSQWLAFSSNIWYKTDTR